MTDAFIEFTGTEEEENREDQVLEVKQLKDFLTTLHKNKSLNGKVSQSAIAEIYISIQEEEKEYTSYFYYININREISVDGFLELMQTSTGLLEKVPRVKPRKLKDERGKLLFLSFLI